MAWVVDLMHLCNNTHGMGIISTQKASHLRCMYTVQRINLKRSSITVVLFHHTNVYKLSDFSYRIFTDPYCAYAWPMSLSTVLSTTITCTPWCPRHVHEQVGLLHVNLMTGPSLIVAYPSCIVTHPGYVVTWIVIGITLFAFSVTCFTCVFRCDIAAVACFTTLRYLWQEDHIHYYYIYLVKFEPRD